MGLAKEFTHYILLEATVSLYFKNFKPGSHISQLVILEKSPNFDRKKKKKVEGSG